MPVNVDVCWGHGTARPSSLHELDAVLASVRERGVPETVFMRNEARECLAFGVGFGASALSYADGDGNTSLSVGDPKLADAPGTTVRDGVTDVLAGTLVPDAVALAAAHEFFERGGRPHVVEWIAHA
jgi:hypothetical protein